MLITRKKNLYNFNCIYAYRLYMICNIIHDLCKQFVAALPVHTGKLIVMHDCSSYIDEVFFEADNPSNIAYSKK